MGARVGSNIHGLSVLHLLPTYRGDTTIRQCSLDTLLEFHGITHFKTMVPELLDRVLFGTETQNKGGLDWDVIGNVVIDLPIR